MEKRAPASSSELLNQRRSSFAKELNNFQAQAASLVHLSKQCKELQSRVGSTETELRTRFRELRDREKRLEEREAKSTAEIESSKTNLFYLTSLISIKSAELGVVHKCLAESDEKLKFTEEKLRNYGEEIEVKNRELNVILGMIDEHKRDLEMKEEEVMNKRKCVEQLDKEMEMKKKDLVDQILTKACELVEERADEVRVKAVEKCKREMERKKEEWCRKLEAKEKEMEELIGKIEFMRGELVLESKILELDGIEKNVKDCLNEVVEREKSIQEREKRLDSVSNELEKKERWLEEQREEFELRKLESEKHFASREKTLDAVKKSIEELKEHSDRQLEDRNSIEERVREQKEQLDSLFNALCLTQRQVEMQEKDLAIRLKRCHCQLNTECLELQPIAMILPQSVCDQPSIEPDRESLDMIHGIIQNFIENKQLTEAVRYKCTFKLFDKFPPVPLLKEFVEYAKKCCIEINVKEVSHDEKDKVIDDRIADLRAVMQCIEDNSLEPQYPPIDIMMDIQAIEELKEKRETVLALTHSNVEKQEQKNKRQRCSSTIYPTLRKYQLRKRRQSESRISC